MQSSYLYSGQDAAAATATAAAAATAVVDDDDNTVISIIHTLQGKINHYISLYKHGSY